MRKLSFLLLLLSLSCALLAVACGPSGKPDDAPVLAQAAPVLAFTTDLLPDAVVDERYEAALPLNMPAEISVTSGALPPGLEMDAAGNITGRPTVTGNWAINVTASDGVTTVAGHVSLHVAGSASDEFYENALRAIVADKRVFGLLAEDMPQLDAARVELGRNLFFDKILSGNKDVACASCHHPAHGFTDALSFSVGVGANGIIGPGRRHPDKVLIPRNSPAIFNSGLAPAMFWDKRVRLQLGPQGQLPNSRVPTQTPEGPMELEPDEAQALFPMADIIEMRGTGHDLDGLDNASYRRALVDRLKEIPEYVSLFEAAFGQDAMTVENMARAIAAFERSQTYVNSAWDRYLLGERNAISEKQKKGAILFFGRANCDNCHNGPMLTDFAVRSIGVPQFGPGKGAGAINGEDYGVEDIVNQRGLRYTFKTPSLRNIALTAPYMHNGAYNTLKDVVMHYRDKEKFVRAFDGKQSPQADELGPPVPVTSDFLRRRAFLFTRVPDNLIETEINELVAFMEALTDPSAVNRRDLVPPRVPSGLPVDN